MAYVEPNVAVFPTLHMPVHSEGGWQHKYGVHKCICAHTHTHTHTQSGGSHQWSQCALGRQGPCSSLQESEEPFVSGKQLAGNDPFHWF